jgi:hypothetical protein
MAGSWGWGEGFRLGGEANHYAEVRFCAEVDARKGGRV